MKCKLSDICEYRKGKVNTSNLTLKTYISTENMLPDKSGVVVANSLPSTTLVQEYKENDTLVSNIRPYFKKVWQAKYDGGCSNDVLVFQGKANVDKDFLYYILANDDFFAYSMATSKGTKMPRGDKKSIMQYELQLFDIKIQKRIASILKLLDKKIELNNAINNNLFYQAKALYKNRFIDMEPFSGKIPDDWYFGTFSEIIEFHDTKRIPLSNRERANLKKIFPYYGATSVMDYVDRYIFDGVYLLISEDGTVADSKGFPILQYVDGQFWVNNHAHIVTGKNGFTVEILYLLFSLTNIQSIITGAVQQKISQSNLKKVPVIIPSKSELNKFDSIIQPIFAQIRNLRAENNRLSNILNILIPRLLSGKLDVSKIEI